MIHPNLQCFRRLNIRVFCANKFAFGRIIRELLKANDFKNETWPCTPPPFRSAVSAYLIYPLIRYFSGIQQHYWLQNRRGLRPGASGKSRTGDWALLCAVLDTSPVVYNPQRLVHEVNHLWRSSQRAQRSNSSNLKTEKIWTYDRTYKELLLACAANCVAGTVAGTILAIT